MFFDCRTRTSPTLDFVPLRRRGRAKGPRVPATAGPSHRCAASRVRGAETVIPAVRHKPSRHTPIRLLVRSLTHRLPATMGIGRLLAAHGVNWCRVVTGGRGGVTSPAIGRASSHRRPARGSRGGLSERCWTGNISLKSLRPLPKAPCNSEEIFIGDYCQGS